MKLVVNSNILFSFFWNDSNTKKVVLKPFFDLHAPSFFFKEFIPENEYLAFIDDAKSISPDSKDVDFFALALKLNCAIWSNDKILKQQSKVRVFSTSDLIKEFGL